MDMKRRGNCYVTCEALYHLLGGKKYWVPMVIEHEGDTHWFLRHKWAVHEGPLIIDPTASQFKTPVPYHKGRGCGFLTKQPSKRARELMEKIVWQE